jgi:hypothetical protein
MNTWRLVVDIFEPGVGRAYPVVRHVFAGKTKEEAEGYFGAHMGTDTFLRGCVDDAHWKDVQCDVSARWYPPGTPVES